MKRSIRIFSLVLTVLMLFTALPLTAHAQDSYPQPGGVGFRIRQDGSFVAVWNLDYSGLSDEVSVSHTLEFYRINQSTEQKMFELEQEGRVNEIDLTPYKEWYFGNTEWSYSVQLTTRYSVIENGTTYTTTMSPVKSSSGLLFDLKIPDPSLTAVESSVFHENDPVLAYDLSWTNMQDDCLLQFALTVNDSETETYTLYPDKEDLPVNSTQTFFLSIADLETAFKEGDRIHCEVQIYRMVTQYNGFPIGDPAVADLIVQPADPDVPKITDASYPNLRAGAKNLRLSVTWEHMPLEDCALELVLTVNDGVEQRFEVTLSGNNAVSDGSADLELSAAYINKTLKAGDMFHTELTFIRDSDGIPLSMTYSFDAVVKAAPDMKYEFSSKAVAVYSVTGEYKEFIISDQEQFSEAEAKAKEWLISKGAQEDAVGEGNILSSMVIYGDGELLPQADFFSFMMSDDYYLYDTITIVYDSKIFYLNRESAVWGDVDRDGDVTSLDVTWIQRQAAEMNASSSFEERMDVPFTNKDFDCGDVDQSGETNIIDATSIQCWLAEMNLNYPIGEQIEA